MKDINEQINKLQKELDQLKAIANKPKSLINRSEYGQSYWFVNISLEATNRIERGSSMDGWLFNSGNYYTCENQAEKVAKHLKDTNMFTRKAIEFADDYKFYDNSTGWSVNFYSDENAYFPFKSLNWCSPTSVYMSEENAKRFAKWLNENMVSKEN